MRLTITLMAMTCALLFCCAAVNADTTTEVKTGTVVAVAGNHVVIKMSNGETKEFDVPDDFMVTVDGKDIPASELKVGTKLSRTITTTTEPKKVYTTTVKNGVVWYASMGTVIITGADGKNRKYTDIPDWIKFTNDGKEISQSDLKKGMNVSATIVTESQSQVVSTTPGGVSGNAPEEAASPSAAPAEPAAAAPMEEKKTLPKTADNLGLLAVAGLALLALSLKLR
jgi:hypothetical protein